MTFHATRGNSNFNFDSTIIVTVTIIFVNPVSIVIIQFVAS